MDVGYVAADGVESAVAAGIRGQGIEPVDVEDAEMLVVAGSIQSDVFEAISSAETPCIAIEIGGIGGRAIDGVTGSVAVLHADGPCYECLTSRVGASHPDAPTRTETTIEHHARFAGAIAGNLLTETADLDTARGQVIQLDGSESRLLAVPGCACEGDHTRFDLPDTAERPASSPVDRAETAVDPILGPIKQVGEQSSYPVPYYVAELADTASMSEVTAAQYAGGVDLDWNAAFMRATGEGLERYSAGMYHLETLPAERSESSLQLESIPTAHEGADPVGRWWPGINLQTDEQVYLPVEAVTFPPPDAADIDAITTGLGLGETVSDAILAGLTEVLERDACMLGWYSTFEPMALEVEHEPYRTLVRRMAGEGLACTSLVMTQDIDLPVVTSIVHRRDVNGDAILDVPHTGATDWPEFAVGSAASIDPTTAATRALSEAIQNWVELRNMGPDQAQSEGAIAEFATFPRQARSMLEVGPTVTTADIDPNVDDTSDRAIEYLIEELERGELTAYVARTTTRDLETLGFEAVRVIVPEAQPLIKRSAHVTERLRQVPRSLGFQPRLDRSDHPYP